MILVTGGTGFLGAHLLAHLIQNNENIRAIYRNESSFEKVKQVFGYYFDAPEKEFSKINWFKTDITDIVTLAAAFENVKYVYHLAAMVSFDPRARVTLHKVNIEGTANIVNLCLDYNVSKLCYSSSVAAIDKKVKQDLIDESGEFIIDQYKSDYSITKHGGEMEVWRGSQEGLDVVIVNPGIILGKGYWNTGSGKLFSKINKGMPFYSKGEMGFVSVEDVVGSMVKLTNSTILNERFILVAENKSYQSIFNAIAENLNKRKPTIEISKSLGNFFWRLASAVSFFTGKEPVISKFSARSMQRKSNFSNKKIQETIGFKFTPIDNTIKSICNSFLKDHK